MQVHNFVGKSFSVLPTTIPSFVLGSFTSTVEQKKTSEINYGLVVSPASSEWNVVGLLLINCDNGGHKTAINDASSGKQPWLSSKEGTAPNEMFLFFYMFGPFGELLVHKVCPKVTAMTGATGYLSFLQVELPVVVNGPTRQYWTNSSPSSSFGGT